MRLVRAATARSGPSLRLVVGALLGVGFIALVSLAVVWNPTPQINTLQYEIGKMSIQVLGVTFLGGIVTAATFKLQQDRERAASDLEGRREQFTVRTDLLTRSTKCAQEMYVAEQHVSRVQASARKMWGWKSKAARSNAISLLDDTYRRFSAESRALETEFGARYGERGTIADPGAPGEAFLRWHQLRDLLTVYYFNLRGSFPGKVLESNSKSEQKHHSGLEFRCMVADPAKPTPRELFSMRQRIRDEFEKWMPEFAKAVLENPFRDE